MAKKILRRLSALLLALSIFMSAGALNIVSANTPQNENQNKAKVTWDLNGGEWNEYDEPEPINPDYHDIGSEIIAKKPRKDGYIFHAWKIKEDETFYLFAGDKYKVEKDITFIAE